MAHFRSQPTSDTAVLSDCLVGNELAGELQDRSELLSLKDDTVLFREGDPPSGVYYLRNGEALLTMQVKDKTVVTVLATEGSLLGLPAVMGNSPYSLSSETRGRAEVYKISGDDFIEIVHRNSRFCVEVVRILAAEVRSARNALAKSRSPA